MRKRKKAKVIISLLPPTPDVNLPFCPRDVVGDGIEAPNPPVWVKVDDPAA